jgi:hypothetical protein
MPLWWNDNVALVLSLALILALMLASGWLAPH